MKHRLLLLSMLPLMLGLTGCDFLFGSKDDPTVDDIFDQGAIDPTLVPTEVGYVPILPVWRGFQNPADVFVGYDEMVYVVDDNGLIVLDQTGTIQRVIPIPGAVEVTQDRRLHTYVAGRVEYETGGRTWNLPAVYRITGTAGAGAPIFIDTLIHPFMDISRRNTSLRTTDEQVEIRGIATNATNMLYVARRGPVNDPTSTTRPDNTILFYSPEGANTGYAVGLNAVSPSLKTVAGVTSIATFATPPQRVFGVEESNDFVISIDPRNFDPEFQVLWIEELFDVNTGTSYEANPDLLTFDETRGERFLYTPNRFEVPVDVFVSTDARGYLFVVDTELDSLYQFTREGVEGVPPPPTAASRQQVIVSFGGEGDGPFEFRDPSGVCYFRETVYVADRGNNRIMRYRLSTDLE